jgi:hypothetical protein
VFTDDDLHHLIAGRDQTTAGMLELAKLLAEFRRALRAEGFDKAESFELARDYFSIILDRALVGDADPEDDE